MHHIRLKTLAAAIAMAATGSVFAAPAHTGGVAAYATVHHATALRAGDRVMGMLETTHPLQVGMSLKLRNKAQLDAFVANPHHPNLTPAQFNAMYAPTLAQAHQVEAFLKQQGFTNVQIAPNRQMVTANGSSGTAAKAFHTSFVNVLTKRGRHAFATASDVQIPMALQGIVHEVVGLQNVHTFHVLDAHLLTPIHTNAGGGTATGHNPADFAAIYNAGNTATGATIAVGIVTEGSMTKVQSDFSSFLSQNPSLGNIPMNVVKVDNASTDTSGDGEWDLDSQDIAGISGGVKSLTLYATSSLDTQPLLDDFNKAVTDNTVRIVNVSIGGCETGSETNGAATGDNIFEQAAAQGITFSISTGDSGADECSNGGVVPSWPSDSQYVVAVGGTELFTSGTTWTNETVWNELASNEGATGGSPSTFEPQPSWQKNVGQNTGSQYRGLPDVAFDGDPNSGASVIVDGSPQQIGGTSLASPLFVGVWARVLAAKPSLGFAAPLIYADAASHYATDFHDVTSGNNSGETAAVGWDYASGFGSINIANFVANVAGSGTPTPTPTPTPGGTFSNNHRMTIGDNATVNSSIKVTGEPGAASANLQVKVNITHNWSGDLEIDLVAPNGGYAELQAPDYGDDGNINTTWAVDASSVQGNGTWKLRVIDNDPWYSGDYGKLNGWSMTF